MNDWISVDDRLPITEKDMGDSNYLGVEVIIYTKHFVSSDWFETGKHPDFWSQFNEYKKEVIGWQPLPELPK